MKQRSTMKSSTDRQFITKKDLQEWIAQQAPIIADTWKEARQQTEDLLSKGWVYLC
jgi:hypothetical protein